jgi:hypothetical protein
MAAPELSCMAFSRSDMGKKATHMTDLIEPYKSLTRALVVIGHESVATHTKTEPCAILAGLKHGIVQQTQYS